MLTERFAWISKRAVVAFKRVDFGFSYELVFAEDQQWGVKLPDGSFNGQLKDLAENVSIF